MPHKHLGFSKLAKFLSMMKIFYTKYLYNKVKRKNSVLGKVNEKIFTNLLKHRWIKKKTGVGTAPTLHATHELYPNFKSQFLTHFQTPQKILKNLAKNSYISKPFPNHHPHTPTKPLPHLTGSPTTAYLPHTLPTTHPQQKTSSTAIFGPGVTKKRLRNFQPPSI